MELFGTDGIRGVVGSQLDYKIALKCGNSVGRFSKNIIIGRDARLSGQMLTSAFCLGAILAGANVVDVGEVSTPCISFLTAKYSFDYGVVISASHNPPEHNGIKVFNSLGKKLSESQENLIEKNMQKLKCDYSSLGTYTNKPALAKEYTLYVSGDICLKGLTVCVDCSNGATKSLAKKVFKNLGAKTYFTGMGGGQKINHKCGATYPQRISTFTKSKKADIGFAFDGDGDRIIVADKYGRVYDGDNILFALSSYFNAKCVVGTTFTNMGLEQALKDKDITLLRSDVGDKWVAKKMEESGAIIGGEQSGHIILSNLLPTGDGLLVAVTLCSLLKQSAKPLKKLLDFKTYPQVIKNVKVKDKEIAKSKLVTNAVTEFSKDLIGRIIVRPSGTEQKLRIMVEATKITTANKIANKLCSIIEKGDMLCAE